MRYAMALPKIPWRHDMTTDNFSELPEADSDEADRFTGNSHRAEFRGQLLMLSKRQQILLDCERAVAKSPKRSRRN